MIPALSPVFGIIIGLNIAFVGYVIAFLLNRPMKRPTAPPADTRAYFRLPGLAILAGGAGYALFSLFQSF